MVRKSSQKGTPMTHRHQSHPNQTPNESSISRKPRKKLWYLMLLTFIETVLSVSVVLTTLMLTELFKIHSEIHSLQETRTLHHITKNRMLLC